MTKGRENMKDDELCANDKITACDSLVSDIDNPTIFVIHENARAYPMFIIYFKC